MRRLRVVLPLVQVAVAAALTTSNFLRLDSWASPAWTKPDRQFCDALNAPAILIAAYPVYFADRWISRYYPLNLVIEAIVYFSLVGLIWYVVSIELGGKGVSILAPKTRMRRVADLIAIIFGAVLGVAGLSISSQFGGNYGRLVSSPYLIWALAIMGFYGHDLWVSFSGAQRPAGR